MKKARAIFLSTLLAFSLISCSQPSESSAEQSDTPKGSAAKRDVTLNFMADTSLDWEKLNPLVEQFTQETGIKVNALVLEESNLWSKTGLEVASPSTEINVIMGHTKDIPAFTAAGYLEPLDDYLAKAPTFRTDDYAKAYLDACRGADGKIYGLPMYHNGMLMIYRADLFAKHGITLPETWDDLEKVCATLKEKEPDMASFAMRGQNSAFGWTMVYTGNGGKYVDENGKSAMDPAIVGKSIDYFVNLMKNYGPQGVANYNYSEIQTDFMQGKLCAFIDSYNVSVRCEDPAEAPLTAGKVGYWTMPKGTLQVGPGFTWAMIVPKNTSHKEESAQFACWLMSPEIASAIDLSSPKQTWTKVFSQPAYADYPQSISMLEAMERTFAFIDCDYEPRDAKFGELKTLISNNVQACLAGSMDSSTAAQAIVDMSQTIYP